MRKSSCSSSFLRGSLTEGFVAGGMMKLALGIGIWDRVFGIQGCEFGIWVLGGGVGCVLHCVFGI